LPILSATADSALVLSASSFFNKFPVLFPASTHPKDQYFTLGSSGVIRFAGEE